MSVVKGKLSSFRKAEKSRIRRKSSKQPKLLSAGFKKNPFFAGQSLLDTRVFEFLKLSESELNDYKASLVKDDLYFSKLDILSDLPPKPSLLKQFPSHTLDFKDFQKLLSSRCNSSSPGINGISYKMYKLCPQICSFLFRIFRSCVKNCVVPIQWRVAKEVYIPKSKTSDESYIKDLSHRATYVEGKLFFSLISKRIEDHVVKNNGFLNKSIQKGGKGPWL